MYNLLVFAIGHFVAFLFMILYSNLVMVMYDIVQYKSKDPRPASLCVDKKYIIKEFSEKRGHWTGNLFVGSKTLIKV